MTVMDNQRDGEMSITAERLAEISELIENDPEWFIDGMIDDAELIEACRLAQLALAVSDKAGTA